MKNILTVFFALTLLFCFFSSSAVAQDGPGDDKIWSLIRLDPSIPSNIDPNYKWEEKTYEPRFLFGADATVEPNFRPWPGSNTTQTELSVDVHPLDENIIFASANATSWPVNTLWGTGVYWSLDGAANWVGFDNPPFGTNAGDPASVIGVNGNFYENYITNSWGQGIAVSTDNGVSWTTHTVAPNPGFLADKNHMMVDKTGGSPYVNRLYVAFTDFGGSNSNDVVIRYSTNVGSTWSSSINLSGSLNAGNHSQGVNVQTASNGDVYAAYAIYDASWQDGEDAIGFSKSTDGGATWNSARVYSAVNFGIRGELKPTEIRVSSFPSMAVDRSGGANDGTIYICWPQKNVAPAGSDPDIVLIKSTDGGTSWSSPVRVNDDPLNNGKDQYYPWMTVDQSTGQAMVVFYDSRETTNDSTGVWMATSVNGGTTWDNFRVSDENFRPKPLGGITAPGYQGDYIGIAALNDVAYPYWMDDRTGNYQGWMSVVSFGPPCPVDPATNPTPANGATDISINLNQISWTNGAGATQLELWYGEAGGMSMVYSGSLITSWNIPGPLTYFTQYNWRIISKNDTCSVNGPVWAFTTEQDPLFVIDTIKVYPQNAAYWTGTTDGVTKTDTSEVRGYGDGEDGWFMFDVSPINDAATITQITFYGYVNTTNWPWWSATPLPGLNPLTASASDLKTAIGANSGQGVAYIYSNESSSFSTGWHDYSMENGANADLEAALAQDWFAMGMDSRDVTATYFLEWDGWAEPNVPYLEVMYNYFVPVELISFIANVNKNDVTLNWVTATEINNQGFEIERNSGNGFAKIGYVAGFGTSTETHSYSFVDHSLNQRTYSYRLKQVDLDGTFEYSDVVEVDVTTPIEYALEQNYPNPFNPSTVIRYSIPQDGMVTLYVFNLLGEKVAALVNGVQQAGRYEVKFDASKLASGIYVYTISATGGAGSFNSVKKMVLLR